MIVVGFWALLVLFILAMASATARCTCPTCTKEKS